MVIANPPLAEPVIDPGGVTIKPPFEMGVANFDYGYKENLVHLYVIGGGGCLLRHYSDIASKGNVTFIEDICANAKGYEYLAMQKQRRQAV